MSKKALGSFLLATISAISMPFIASATAVKISDNLDSPQEITIQRSVNGVTNPVTNSFTYSISAYSANPAPVNNLPESMTIDFVDVAPTDNVATKSGTLDFSNVEFTEIGDYKFLISETNSSNQKVYPVDSNHQYYLCVSVRNELDNNGQPTGNLIPTLMLQVKDVQSDDKTDARFESNAQFTYIEISKDVTGNMARTDQYFLFSLMVNGAGVKNGDRFIISGQDEEVFFNGQTIHTNNEYVVGETNALYLKHGQTVTIGKSGDLAQLPIDMTFVISEATPSDYTSFVNGKEGSSTGWIKAVALGDDNELPESNKVHYINHKESNVLTGVSTAFIPMAVLAALGTGGYVITRRLRKNEK